MFDLRMAVGRSILFFIEVYHDPFLQWLSFLYYGSLGVAFYSGRNILYWDINQLGQGVDHLLI